MLLLLITVLIIAALLPSINKQYAQPETVLFEMEHNLVITDIGNYTGKYVEDGSNEKVENIFSITVKNKGEKTLQYAEVTLNAESEKALFQVSTLKPGQSVLILESEKKQYLEEIVFKKTELQHVVFFEEEPDCKEDEFMIQPLDGGFNIKNVTGKDINGEIIIYYKNKKDNYLLGGITYRGRIRNGLKAGEVKQIMSDNFTEKQTEVVFITITE